MNTMMKIDEFLNDSNYSEHTVRSYRWLLEQLAESIGDQDPATVTREQFRSFLETRDWGGNTCYTCTCAVRSYYRWSYGKTHALSTVRTRRPRPSPQRTLNEDEAMRLMESLDTSTICGIRNLAMISLMLDCGLRCMEVCRLEVAHLYIEARSLETITKGGSWGRGVYSEYTASCLAAWMATRSELTIHQPRYVFVSPRTGRRLSESWMRKLFARLAKRSGLKALSPHDLRRTFATLALRAGAPTRVVQVAGRWSTLDMVERYSMALRPEDIEPFSPINKLMGL